MPPKPPPRMSILLVVIVQNLPRLVSGPCGVLSEADGLWSLEYPFDAASLPKVRQQVAVATMLSAATGPALAPFPHVERTRSNVSPSEDREFSRGEGAFDGQIMELRPSVLSTVRSLIGV